MTMDIMEFSKYAEENFVVDHEIDKKQKELVLEYLDGEHGVIAEGRLSAYFLDPDIRVWLYTPFEVRVKRIMVREGYGREEAIKKIKLREESERKRYREIYNINLDDLSIYDIVLNTERTGESEILANEPRLGMASTRCRADPERQCDRPCADDCIRADVGAEQ